MESLAVQYRSLHEKRLEDAQRAHALKLKSMEDALADALARLEEKAAELAVANGMTTAASARADEHLQDLRTTRDELCSTQKELQLLRDELKQREIDAESTAATWKQEKDSLMLQGQETELQLDALKQKLSSGMSIEKRALPVRSIVATSRALHPCYRMFSLWMFHVRRRQRASRSHAEDVFIPRLTARFVSRIVLRSTFAFWQQLLRRNYELLHVDVAVTCLIIRRRLKNFFGLWVQLTLLSNSSLGKPSFSSHEMLCARGARMLLRSLSIPQPQSLHLTSHLACIIQLFSAAERSDAIAAVTRAFKICCSTSSVHPRSHSHEADELCVSYLSCLQCISENLSKNQVHVSLKA
jgi:hypothetical protein